MCGFVLFEELSEFFLPDWILDYWIFLPDFIQIGQQKCPNKKLFTILIIIVIIIIIIHFQSAKLYEIFKSNKYIVLNYMLCTVCCQWYPVYPQLYVQYTYTRKHVKAYYCNLDLILLLRNALLIKN